MFPSSCPESPLGRTEVNSHYFIILVQYINNISNQEIEILTASPDLVSRPLDVIIIYDPDIDAVHAYDAIFL